MTIDTSCDQLADVQRLGPTCGIQDGPARYCQAVKHGDTLYVAGQTAKDLSGGAAKSYESQVKQVLQQLEVQLARVGTSKENLLSVRVYLKDVKAGAAVFNRCWDAWVAGGHLPARTTVQAAMLDQRMLVEVDAVAACTPGSPLAALAFKSMPSFSALKWPEGSVVLPEGLKGVAGCQEVPTWAAAAAGAASVAAVVGLVVVGATMSRR